MNQTILVLNVGSSSIKFAVAYQKNILLHGVVEGFGRQASFDIIRGTRRTRQRKNIPNLNVALLKIKRQLQQEHVTPTIIAHRIVHGGQRFSKPTKLTTPVLRYLHSLIELAPLHQPANLLGVEFAQRAWPEATPWGFFDTALYHHLPTSVSTYALPKNLTRRLRIQKYGFHGLSHQWAFTQAVKKLGAPAKKISGVTLHLGSGASITLWYNGRPIDTTMGFTPLEGLVMSTRSGDIDPAIPLYIQQKLGWSASRVKNMLEQHSGLVGLSGLSDMRDVLSAAGHHVPGWPRQRWSVATRTHARLALDIFSYHIRRALSGYLGLLERPRAIIFTGPVGENRTVQKILLKNLPATRGIRCLTIPANEEQAIVDEVSA